MKTLSALSLLVFLTASLSQASEKICVSTSGYDKGLELRVSLSAAKLRSKPTPADGNSYSYVGSYESNGGHRAKTDGTQQVGYDGYDEGEGVEFWVDLNLFQDGTTGLIEATSLGEGKSSDIFSCKDAR